MFTMNNNLYQQNLLKINMCFNLNFLLFQITEVNQKIGHGYPHKLLQERL